jgi:hypothetical protein
MLFYNSIKTFNIEKVHYTASKNSHEYTLLLKMTAADDRETGVCRPFSATCSRAVRCRSLSRHFAQDRYNKISYAFETVWCSL